MTTSNTYKIYGYWRSSASWRIRWALELKGLEYEYIPVNLVKGEQNSSEHLARNPLGKVPVLVTPDGHALTQSVSVLEFLEEAHPSPKLLPEDRLEKAKCRELVEIINADTAPFQTPFVQKRHSADADEQLAWAQEWIRKGLSAFSKLLPESNGEYCLQNGISLADLFLVPQIYNALRYQISVENEYPALWKIYQNALATSACQKASPESQIDAPKP